ncbi:DNA adenine methylase [Sedimenticola hydrogenitrophicus]|uniref:DNA adenine methylase n=1 Tax=Sedimenticola hydrogenitrophicus TaxID=2967975 RepID=UPI0023B1CC19
MHKPIIPWIGGKRRLAKHILPHINGHQTYVEPFAGGAAIFFMKEPSKVEVINDINSDLVTLYRVVKYHLDELIRHFRWALVSREEFLLAKRVDPETLTDIQRAARFFFLQKSAFGGLVQNRSFGVAASTPPRLNLLRIEEDLSQAHLRLARTYIEHLPWAECIRRYDKPETVFFLDPPYWGTEGYDVEFGLEQYQQIADLAGSIQGHMLITLNDIPEMREIFAGLNIETVPIAYTVSKSSQAKRNELIIRNWP